MGKNLVLFGDGDIAELAHFYFKEQTDYNPVAFTVDKEFLKSNSFCDLPVIPFHELREQFDPIETDVFIALAYSRINALRKEKYLATKDLGYKLASFVSPYATLLNKGRIGENCFILEDNTIQPYVSIGNNVTLWSGNHIGHHSVIRDHVFIASHVVISGGVEIGEQCFIGVNATLRDHIKIGEKCVLGAGTLLLSDAEPEGLYVGSATERSSVPTSRLRKI